MTVNKDVDIAARDLEWEGCDNVRDRGGLPTTGGGKTAPRRIVRANNLDLLTRDGWQALWDFGVRTVVDLRNEEECRTDVVRPAGLTMVRVAFDTYASTDWIRQWYPPGLPNNLGLYLADYPQALADFGKAIASARDGGIVVHCAGGRDRTGPAAMLLLVHAGVEARIAAADWEHSIERLGRYHAREGTENVNDDYLGAPDPKTLARSGAKSRTSSQGCAPRRTSTTRCGHGCCNQPRFCMLREIEGQRLGRLRSERVISESCRFACRLG